MLEYCYIRNHFEISNYLVFFVPWIESCHVERLCDYLVLLERRQLLAIVGSSFSVSYYSLSSFLSTLYHTMLSGGPERLLKMKCSYQSSVW